MIATQERRPAPLPMLGRLRRLRSLLSGPSLRDLDRRITGGEVAWFREALSARRREDAYWVERDFSAGVADVTARVQMVTGWYDSFLPWQLEDFAALQRAGRPRQLIIGPWSHAQEGLTATSVREGLAWLRGHLLGDPRLIEPITVRVFVTGERTGGGWRDFERWPPCSCGPAGANPTSTCSPACATLTRQEPRGTSATRWQASPPAGLSNLIWTAHGECTLTCGQSPLRGR
jgi:predicted acyl esterase